MNFILATCGVNSVSELGGLDSGCKESSDCSSSKVDGSGECAVFGCLGLIVIRDFG
jgi:hypothetical protein